jgi:hypothetical protein
MKTLALLLTLSLMGLTACGDTTDDRSAEEGGNNGAWADDGNNGGGSNNGGNNGGNNGAGNNGPANNGAGNNGPANNGAGNNGPANNGAGNNGPANNGAGNNGQQEDRPDLPLGPADAAASKSCTLFDAGTQVLAVSNRGDAGQVVILPSDSEAYMVTLPEGEGFLTIEVPDWEAEIAFSAHHSTSFQVLGSDQLQPLSWNGACGDDKGITETRLIFHSWGAFTVQYGAEGPREAWFSAIHLNP